ncbi:sensor histidine kinase [Calothrix sp. 336/3]|uniref:sensor histidine kinase n=1 Tax=Calothrix sp. 336/3 TaxID=1337936 RepID=UPI0004E40283|nr:ATP-binding protein [Calothrix sp. 336/3]AKG24288.1 histidine kinase [Calothrix sp. 336/3]
MLKQRQSSFRRILVSKILLLSVPVLLIGETVAYKKASSSLLDTSRQNLTANAIIKGKNLDDAIATLKANLFTASQTEALKSGEIPAVQLFFTQLTAHLPPQVECIQLTNAQTQQVITSTCSQTVEMLSSPSPDGITIEPILPPKFGTTGKRETHNHLRLLLSSPVYDKTGQWRYNLIFQSKFAHEIVTNQPGVLAGSTVIIAENGTILSHPISSYIGSNINEHDDAERLAQIVKDALQGHQDSLHLFFGNKGEELLVGYTAINNPTIPNQKWVIMAVTPVSNALYGLGQIKVILVTLTVGLVATSLAAALYLARCLARPVEELRDYALNLHSHNSTTPVPRDFSIREFNQLSQALDQMVERLKAWAEEVEASWQEAKAANQSKTQLLATASHELRNPLNTILNYVRLVREGLCDSREEELEYLQIADSAAMYLLAILNNILDNSKSEAGKLAVALEAIDLRDILKDVVNLQSVNVQQKGLQLNISQMETAIPVNVDPLKLKQVLINVIGNATKFTEVGSINIHTKMQATEAEPQVIILIQDTGIGIDLAQQQKLFRPYVMVDSNSARKGGTGLGLAISRNLIELMGGTITLESAGLHQGTTVKITLPLLNTEALLSVQQSEVTDENALLFAPSCLSVNICPASSEK